MNIAITFIRSNSLIGIPNDALKLQLQLTDKLLVFSCKIDPLANIGAEVIKLGHCCKANLDALGVCSPAWGFHSRDVLPLTATHRDKVVPNVLAHEITGSR